MIKLKQTIKSVMRHYLNEQENTESIDSIILDLIDEYGYTYDEDPIDINEGNCANFAEDLLERLGGKSENTYIIEVQRDLGGYREWFKDSDGRYKFEKYGKLPDKLILSVNQDIEKFKGEYNRWLNDTGVGINKFKVGDHYWVYHNGKHYDAETPRGVKNMFQLPIFKRYINFFIKRYKN
jgi:hypothetical protein